MSFQSSLGWEDEVDHPDLQLLKLPPLPQQLLSCQPLPESSDAHVVVRVPGSGPWSLRPPGRVSAAWRRECRGWNLVSQAYLQDLRQGTFWGQQDVLLVQDTLRYLSMDVFSAVAAPSICQQYKLECFLFASYNLFIPLTIEKSPKLLCVTFCHFQCTLTNFTDDAR